MAIELKVRDMHTGNARVTAFETVDEAEAWLRARPAFTEVLGPSRPGAIAPADEQRLRAAMRPLDDEERKAEAEQDARNAEVIRKALAGEEERMRKEIEARREQNRTADPNRPMMVSWERGKGLYNSDPADDRKPTQAIHDALKAWVAERDTWVHPRGQYIISAQVVVWPGPLPPGTDEDERVQMGGKFEVLYGTPPELN